MIATYDNPISYCPLGGVPGAELLGDIALEGYAPLGIAGLNNVIREAAAASDVAVADTFGRLGADSWSGDCLHPNDNGYAEISRIVETTIHG